ncbi:MAG TPA: TetR/AcrR family transcriptional regulator [Bacillota bacterium]|nr:TetR/AcrR family transcriptional regulator [Bacillota bacterium]
MKETRQNILNASLEVFSEKGFNQATTLEISNSAGVAEMTLFRKFQTKQNLFIETVKYALGVSFGLETEIDYQKPLVDFLKEVLHQKMLLISKHNRLVKMLIRESLSHTIPDELDVTKRISKDLMSRIETYVSMNKVHLNPEAFSEVIAGILLRYAIMEDQPIYHLIDHDEQLKYIENYINVLNV